MKNQLQTRLTELNSEFATGQTQLADIDKKRRELEGILLRINGAIQVLEEVLNEAGQGTAAVEPPMAQQAQRAG